MLTGYIYPKRFACPEGGKSEKSTFHAARATVSVNPVYYELRGGGDKILTEDRFSEYGAGRD